MKKITNKILLITFALFTITFVTLETIDIQDIKKEISSKHPDPNRNWYKFNLPSQIPSKSSIKITIENNSTVSDTNE